MQIKNLFKPALSHLLAIAIFLFISLIYFYPVLEGKALHTNDGSVAKNSSKEIRDYREKYGKEPLWTNSMFSGMPAYLISTRFPGNLMRYADALIRVIKMPVSSIFLTMLGFYILLLIFRVKPWLAIAGAIAYGLSTYFFFILSAGHYTKAIAIAYMAPMIGGIYYTYRFNAVKGALLATFFLTLEIIANHPQITYYAFLCLLVFLITEFIYSIKQREIVRFIKRSAILFVPLVLSVGMNFASLYTTYEYGKYSIRGKSDLISANKNYTSGLDKDYATQWSYGIDETLTLLIPNFKGGANIPFDRTSETVRTLRKNNAGQYVNQFQKYWGTQPWTDGPVYVGAIVVFLFVLGLIIVKGPEKWWLLAATLLSVMLAWGKNFMPLTNLFMDYFPGYNKFRAVTMTLVIAEFCIPLLGILALRDIFGGLTPKKEFMKGLRIAFGVTGGLALLFVLSPGLAGSFLSPNEQGQIPDWLSTALISDRETLLRGDAFRSFIFILLGATLLLGYYYEKIKKEYIILLLAILFLTDMYFVDKRYLNADKFVSQIVSDKSSAPTTADNLILKDNGIFRVLNLSVSPFNDASTSAYHKSIGGYHGAKLRRYQELIDSVILHDLLFYNSSLNSAKSLEDLQPALHRLSFNNAIRMLNTKYFIINPEMAPIMNNNTLGNAWFADTVIFAENANNELSFINKINPAKHAVVDVQFKNQVKKSFYSGNERDSITLTSCKPDELVYKYSCVNERLVVFSEIYYPAGWKASIDGKKENYFRTDFLLRGMVVPAGTHEIRFVFKPASYYAGNKISLASSMIFILLCSGYITIELRKLSKSSKNDPS